MTLDNMKTIQEIEKEKVLKLLRKETDLKIFEILLNLLDKINLELWKNESNLQIRN